MIIRSSVSAIALALAFAGPALADNLIVSTQQGGSTTFITDVQGTTGYTGISNTQTATGTAWAEIKAEDHTIDVGNTQTGNKVVAKFDAEAQDRASIGSVQTGKELSAVDAKMVGLVNTLDNTQTATGGSAQLVGKFGGNPVATVEVNNKQTATGNAVFDNEIESQWTKVFSTQTAGEIGSVKLDVDAAGGARVENVQTGGKVALEGKLKTPDSEVRNGQTGEITAYTELYVNN